jgi:RNA polymerase sporulation-specific sigma factor
MNRTSGILSIIQIRLWAEKIKNILKNNSKSIFYIGGSDVLPPPLERDEESKILEQYNNGSKEARAILIERNLRLVVYIAKKFENAGINVEDLISIGTIGLIKAVNTFKLDKNIKLATYASRCIENEILMHLRRNTRIKTEVSLDEPLNVDWDGNELLLSDILGTENDVVYHDLEEEVNRKLLYGAMKKLEPRDKELMEMRFGLKTGKEMTQKEVADRLGISQSYISRLEKRIISRLQKEIKKLG